MKKKMSKKTIIIIVCTLFAVLAISMCGGNSGSSSSSTADSTNSATPTEEAAPDTIAYEFKWLGSTATLKLNAAEGTAQLIFGQKTYYGRCMYGHPVVSYEDSKAVENCWIIEGFTGTDNIDMDSSHNGKFNGEYWWWEHKKYIDPKNNFMYLNTDAYTAKNPDYRVEVTPMK